MATSLLGSGRARIAAVVGVVLALITGGSLAASITHRALESSRDELAEARVERRTTRRSLVATREDIEAETFGRELLRAQLEEVERQIKVANGSLDTTRRKAASRFTRIPLLTECLNGVASALNASSVGDERSAVLAIATIEPTCARAQGRER